MQVVYDEISVVILLGRDIDNRRVFNVEYENKDTNKVNEVAIKLAKEHNIEIIRSWKMSDEDMRIQKLAIQKSLERCWKL